MSASSAAMISDDPAAEGGGSPTRTGRIPRRALRIALAVAGLGLALDQSTKALAVSQLQPGDRVPLIGDLLGLSVIYNPGAAFSLGSGATLFFTVVGVLTVPVTIAFAVRLRGHRWGITLGLVLGGAIGNLVDRLANPPSFGLGHVTDFIAYGDLFVGNVADILIVTGIALICLNPLSEGQRESRRTERHKRADEDVTDGHR